MSETLQKYGVVALALFHGVTLSFFISGGFFLYSSSASLSVCGDEGKDALSQLWWKVFIQSTFWLWCLPLALLSNVLSNVFQRFVPLPAAGFLPAFTAQGCLWLTFISNWHFYGKLCSQ
jgi:hypothetical protein